MAEPGAFVGFVLLFLIVPEFENFIKHGFQWHQGKSIYFTSRASGNTGKFLPAPADSNVQGWAGFCRCGDGAGY
ncbi:MAG: hypothetical protein LUG15_01195, partial [Oscillospiraceae bacterium]|nr:hypothetical protein [Oscillospiraceae bacterium]